MDVNILFYVEKPMVRILKKKITRDKTYYCRVLNISHKVDSLSS